MDETITQPAPPATDGPAPDMGPDENAPFGYMIDRATGEKRAKKRPGGTGRPRLNPDGPPDLTELHEAGPLEHGGADRPPGAARRGKRARMAAAAKENAEQKLPPVRPGQISKGVDKLYRRAGKILKAWDREIGEAVLLTTVKLDDDDVTVGEAWEELAARNPRVKAFLLKLITSGAWSTLIMAHAPILMAILMKDAIRSRLPLGDLLGAFTADTEQEADAAAAAPGMGNPFAGLTQEDMAAMAAQAAAAMAGMNGTGMPGPGA